MKKRVLNVHVSFAEAAHIETVAKEESISKTMALRMLIRDDMIRTAQQQPRKKRRRR